MTWKSHQLISFAGAMALGFPLTESIAIAVFSVLPDAIEGFIPNAKHRGNSHFWGIWLLMLLVGGLIIKAGFSQGEQAIFLAGNIICLASIASIFHIVEDSLTISGVPIFPLLTNRNFSIPLCKTRESSEMVVTVMMIFCLFFIWKTGFVQVPYISLREGLYF